MYHYVYLLEHIETGEFYIGSRSCEIHPSLDSYLGSMCKWKPEKHKLKKTIINVDFSSREEANIFEFELIVKHINEPLNRNYALPAKSWNYELKGEKNPFFGKLHSDYSKKMMSESAKNRNISDYNENQRRHKISESTKGKILSEETKKKISESKKKEKIQYYTNLRENNINPPLKGKIYEKILCPHCGKIVSITKAKQWHFDNCKNNRK